MVASYSLNEGDIIINRVNSPSHLGKSFLVQAAHTPALFESNMMRLRPAPAMSGDYLELYLTSPFGRSHLSRNAKMAVNQASINQGDVRAVPISIPPREEQGVVVELQRTNGHQGLLRAIQEQTDTSGLLRQSILAVAFRGELL